MTTWIALLRGVNVTGRNKLPMADFRKDLEAAGLKQVRTYIQSGNVVFDSDSRSAAALAERIAACIDARNGFTPMVLVLRSEDLEAAVHHNPYPQAAADPKSLHFFFLEAPARNARIDVLEEARSGTEAFRLTDRVFYLHAPDGIGRSKLAARIERCLGVHTTARNYRTVDTLLKMANGDA